MLSEISINYHSSIRINNKKIIYIDPFKIKGSPKDADIILITHSHYDHFSEADIKKVKNSETVIYITKDLYNNTVKLGFNGLNIRIVEPNNEYMVDDKISLKSIPAYNNEKEFHKKENNWVGYLIEINKKTYYIAGDTDITEENKQVKCDVALVPVGGTYTMDFKEAAKLINIIQPSVAIPIHYNSIIGKPQDGTDFMKLLRKNIECYLPLNKKC